MQSRLGSSLDGLVRFWPNASGPEVSWRERIITPPTFRLGCVLPQMAQIILWKTRLDLIWFWLTVRFWPNGSSPEAIWCASIIQPASSQWQCFQAHPDRMFYAKPGWIQFGSGWLCPVLAKWIWSGSKLVCKNHLAHFWPMLPSQSGSDVNKIQHVYCGTTITIKNLKRNWNKEVCDYVLDGGCTSVPIYGQGKHRHKSKPNIYGVAPTISTIWYLPAETLWCSVSTTVCPLVRVWLRDHSRCTSPREPDSSSRHQTML